MGLKRCSGCKVEKPLSEFWKREKGRNDYVHLCKPCSHIQQRTAYYRTQYGITIDDYDEMLLRQNGCCGICGSKRPGGPKNNRFAVDHDHETGKVRGLLCSDCNLGLGKFSDNPELLHLAAKWIENAR